MSIRDYSAASYPEIVRGVRRTFTRRTATPTYTRLPGHEDSDPALAIFEEQTSATLPGAMAIGFQPLGKPV